MKSFLLIGLMLWGRGSDKSKEETPAPPHYTKMFGESYQHHYSDGCLFDISFNEEGTKYSIFYGCMLTTDNIGASVTLGSVRITDEVISMQPTRTTCGDKESNDSSYSLSDSGDVLTLFSSRGVIVLSRDGDLDSESDSSAIIEYGCYDEGYFTSADLDLFK